MVQGAILLILEAAYEAEFEKINCNFGFRPHKDTNEAMEKINMEAKFCQFAVEGDIKGTYDIVQHETLIKILGERFTDKKFLRFLQRGLKCGYLLEFKKYETLLGTSQGSISSPIVFNIYRQIFDKFVENDDLLQQETQNQGTQKNETNIDYEKYKSKKRLAKYMLKKFIEIVNPFCVQFHCKSHIFPKKS